jgi:hypothetical protein
MSISLKVDSDGDFLRCQGSGEFSIKEACSWFHDIIAAAIQHGATKVLVDCLQIVGNPTTVDRYEFAECLAREVVGYINERNEFPRLAIVGKEPLLDPNRFGELVARNRGVKVKVVERMEDALKWLEVGLTENLNPNDGP